MADNTTHTIHLKADTFRELKTLHVVEGRPLYAIVEAALRAYHLAKYDEASR